MKAILRLVLPAILLLSNAVEGQAQNLIFFQKTDSKSYLVRYGAGGPSQGVTDYFVRTLSQGNGKGIDRTEFILVHDQSMRATKLSPSEFQLYVTIQALRLSGDTHYRGFDMAEMLKPSSVKFTLERVNAQGRVMDSWDFGSVPLNTDPAVLANFKGRDSLTNFDDNTFRFRDLSFLYLPEDKTPFAVRSTLIDEYYGSIPQLEDIYGKLKKIDPESIEQLNTSETDLRRLSGQIEAVKNKQFEQNLNLSAQLDPAGYLPRFQEVEAYSAELATRIRDNKANLHRLYYERGQAYLEQGDRPKALADLQTAINMQPTYAPAHLALARLRYQEGNLVAASDRLLLIFRELKPSPDVRGEAATLAGTIYQNRLGNASYALQQKRLENALEELDGAAALCGGIPELNCTQQMDALYGQAHGGVFAGLASNAEKSLSSGNPEQAINEALVARQYAVQHSPYVTDTAQIVPLLNEAYRAQFQQILAGVEPLLLNKDIDGAEQQIERAKAFRQAHIAALPDAGALTALENKVADRRYKYLIAEGKNLAGQGQWSQALGQYEKATEVEGRFQVQKDPQLPQLAKATAKALLAGEIAKSLELARSNRLSEARNIRLAVDEVRSRYALQGDADIEGPYMEMKEAIFNQECANAQAEFDEIIKQADRNKDILDYIGADASYFAALAVVSNNAPCGLDPSPAQSGKAEIAPAVAYQQKLKEVKTAIGRALYRDAVGTYQRASEDFATGDLGSKFRLQHVPLFTYLRNSGNDEFIKYGVDHYAEAQDYDAAIALLSDLVGRRYPKGRLKVQMTRIGEALAVRDFQADPSTDPKVRGLEYTKGDRGLKKLYKAYRKEWKQMD